MCHNGHRMGQFTFTHFHIHETFTFITSGVLHVPQRTLHGPVQFHFHFHIHETFTFTTSGVLHVPQRTPHGPVHLSRRNSFLIAARNVRLEGEGDLDQNNDEDCNNDDLKSRWCAISLDILCTQNSSCSTTLVNSYWSTCSGNLVHVD